MNNKNTVRVLRAFSGRWLDKAETDTKRSLRKLVEFGYSFSATAKIKSFFREAGSILRNNKSKYYLLFRNLAGRFDKVGTIEFGIIFGYYGLVKGANSASLHKQEKDADFSLAAVINGSDGQIVMFKEDLSRRVSELSNIGAAVFFIFCDCMDIDAGALCEIADSQPHKAFFLFTDNYEIAITYSRKNVMPVMDVNGGNFAEISAELLLRKRLFAGYCSYNDSNAESFTGTEFLDRVCETGCPFLFLIEENGCSESSRDKVSKFSFSQKRNPSHPLFITEFYGDIDWLNRTIREKKKQILSQKRHVSY